MGDITNFISVVIALGSFVWNIVNIIKNNKFAQEIENRNKKYAEKVEKINNANTEIAMRELINRAQEHFENVTLHLGSKISKIEKLQDESEELQEEIEMIIKVTSAAKERMLNSYDEICMKYLDGKIDKERFKKAYSIEIINLVDEFQDFYNKNKNKRGYQATITVYDEWTKIEGTDTK